MKLSIIIPAFNEEMVIKETIAEVFTFFKTTGVDLEVIVVDDGSTDKTKELVRAELEKYPELKLLANEYNSGKGYSVKKGALSASGDWILFLDADLSTRPEEFAKFKPHLGAADIIIGSRDVNGSQILKKQRLFRRLSSKFLKALIKLFVNLGYPDTQCGFKCFSRKSLIIFSEQQTNRWMFDLELLALAKKHGLRVVEVPVNWTNDESSTVKAKDIFNILRDLMIIKKQSL